MKKQDRDPFTDLRRLQQFYVVLIPTKQGCEKGNSFVKKLEKLLLSTHQITNQIRTTVYMGNLLRRGVKRERLFLRKEKFLLFTSQITVHGKSFEKGCEKGNTF